MSPLSLHPLFVAGLFFYVLSAFTNVMVLGAFTESWLQTFPWSRTGLSQIYCYATLLVALTVGFSGLCYEKLGFRKTCVYAHCGLGILCLCISFLPPQRPYACTFTVLLFLLQWLGQGLLVIACRSTLISCLLPPYQGLGAGLQESLGTVAVSVFPFLLLKLNQQFAWQNVLRFESLLYFLAALISFFLPNLLKPTKEPLYPFWAILRTKKFWIINSLINLPILLSSGFFFHIEALSRCWNISIPRLHDLLLPQIIGILCVHLLLGLWVAQKQWSLKAILTILALSQSLWYISLSHLSTPLGGTFYVLSNAIGWGCFGILINVTWKHLYGTAYSGFCLGWAVGLGFVFNALGPLLFACFV